MADNVQTEAVVSTGAIFATDDDAGVHHPYTKLEWGPNDTFNKVDDADGKRLPVKAILSPSADGTLDPYHAVLLNTNNAASIKGSAGQVYVVDSFNNAGYPFFVKLYNKATAPAPATDSAVLMATIGVQAGVGRTVTIEKGSAFSTGIGIAVVKGIGTTDNTALDAVGDGVVNVAYK